MNLLGNSSISDFETAGKTRISVLGSNVRLTNITVRNCVSIDNGQKKIQEKQRFGAGFLGGSPTMQFVDCTSERNSVGFRLSDGATAIRCRDTGSIQGFRTSGGNVTMNVFIDRAPSSTVTFSVLLTATSRLFTGPPSTVAAVSVVLGLRLECYPSLGDRSPDRSVHQTL